MKQVSRITFMGSLVILAACGSSRVLTDINKLTGNVTTPVYTPFNLPQSSIELPSIFVGSERSIENVCFKSSTSTEEMSAPDSLKIVVNRDTKMETSFQAEFEKELIKAGLSAELARSTSNKISVDVEGMSLTKLTDISQVAPDFNNAACNTNALKYYVDNRIIITGALKAEKYIVKSESGLTSDIKSKLDIVMDTLNIKLKMAFERAASASGEFEYAASDVYFGALTTKLAVVECVIKAKKVLIDPNGLYEIEKKNFCTNYKARFKRSSISSDFAVEIFPENNPRIGSGQVDVTEGKVTDILVNDVTLAAVTIDQIPNSDNFNIDLSIYIVGVSAEEVQ